LEGSPEEALRGMMRFMNVQYHYQSLLRREMGQLVNAARSLHREATRHITQVDQLRALVIEKDGIIATQNETIHHREDQINESDATITQRNTVIEFLQEQIHDLILKVDDANAHINELQQQPVPPAVLVPKEEEEDPEEIEGVSEIDSEHGDPVISPHHSSSGSQSSVENFDDF
jgi:chromosome segregation ATPase